MSISTKHVARKLAAEIPESESTIDVALTTLQFQDHFTLLAVGRIAYGISRKFGVSYLDAMSICRESIHGPTFMGMPVVVDETERLVYKIFYDPAQPPSEVVTGIRLVVRDE